MVQEYPTILNTYFLLFPQALASGSLKRWSKFTYRQEYLVMSEGREPFHQSRTGAQGGEGETKGRRR